MILKLKNELGIINFLGIILLIIIILDKFKVLRLALGLPFVLFFPGYVFNAALFPRKNNLDSLERVALSFGLSIALVPLIGLILNYTPWGIRLWPILISLTAFTFGMSVVAWIRRRRLSEESRFNIVFRLNFASGWHKSSLLDRILTMVLICSVAVAVGVLVYIIAMPKVGEKFTEFYILGPEGKAEGYPRELVVGEKAEIILGIVNHEYKPVKYRPEIRIAGEIVGQVDTIILKHEEKWENRVVFTPSEPGENIKVEFLLYKNEGTEPYRKLHFWVDVVPGS